MCRNITILRGLEPPATDVEIEDAARQFIRKVAGIQSASLMRRPDVQAAIQLVADATRSLIVTLPPRRTAPPGPPQRWRSPDDE
ncbi:MAG: DUF2277 domain-containing protein [Acidimicrobiaceae bacterium]|nr:DUF2277 domain-containing protein [Acidimicrobiaceae bacterium]